VTTDWKGEDPDAWKGEPRPSLGEMSNDEVAAILERVIALLKWLKEDDQDGEAE